jgi:hypothetical protein
MRIVGGFLREHIVDRPWRRLFVASVSFFLTFGTVRGMVFCIVHHIPPFHYITMEGRHIHHLVFGILILLLVEYCWLCEIGNGSDSSSVFASLLLFNAMKTNVAWQTPEDPGGKTTGPTCETIRSWPMLLM